MTFGLCSVPGCDSGRALPISELDGRVLCQRHAVDLQMEKALGPDGLAEFNKQMATIEELRSRGGTWSRGFLLGYLAGMSPRSLAEALERDHYGDGGLTRAAAKYQPRLSDSSRGDSYHWVLNDEW